MRGQSSPFENVMVSTVGTWVASVNVELSFDTIPTNGGKPLTVDV
jgi:hypothetical protein